MPISSPEPVLRQPGAAAPTVSVIVPTIAAHADCRACCEALMPQLWEDDELIVVLDGGEAQDAEALPAQARVVRHAQRRGPAFARNRGAEAATGDLLFFIDADCVAAPDALAHVRAAFAAAPNLDALIGSYDAQPAHGAFLSQYRNLLHHYTHQTAHASISTFWGACGAVRAKAFAGVGGFDETYAEPCIEDIELGYRLERAGGTIRLDKNLQVKHRKAWSAWGMLRTDVFRRALPWTELLLRKGAIENNLNVNITGRFSIALVGAVILTMALVPWAPWAFALSLLLAGVFVALNLPFYRFLRAVRSRRFAVRAIPWHALYYACGGLGFALGTLRHGWTILRTSLFPVPPQAPTPCPTYSSREPAPLD
jgi:GT2 family glycosyltransferase